MKYIAIYEPAPGGDWGAYVPDLPGCTSGGDTLEAVRENVKDAIVAWIEVERARGHAIPPARSVVEAVDVA
jgi:predicted RNase H-like HicB family nuclease